MTGRLVPPEDWGARAHDGKCDECGVPIERHYEPHTEPADCPTWWDFCHCARLDKDRSCTDSRT